MRPYSTPLPLSLRGCIHVTAIVNEMLTLEDQA
jgi:hypothetical protein